MKRHMAIGMTALLGVSLLAACGSDDDSDGVSDVKDANTEYCQNLAAYESSLTAIADLDPATATKEEFQSAADAAKSARSDLADSRADLVGAELDNLVTQADDLDGVLSDAPDDAVISDIVTAAQTQVAEVRVSAAAVNTAVCTPGNSASTTEG